MIKLYLSVTKPGIIFGNLVAALAGFMLASKGQVDAYGLIAMSLGVIFIVASGCVYNNVVDRDIDALMKRTQKRALVTGAISIKAALTYATVLLLVGLGILAAFSTIEALLFGVLGFAVYVGLYTLKFKRQSVFGTLIGSISGACPPVIGYCAASGQFDLGSLVLLMTFCLWQIPHSYAIAINHYEDYKKAGIPVLPIVESIPTARKHMIVFITMFTLVALALFVFDYVGAIYASLTVVSGVLWLAITIFGYQRLDTRIWGRHVFSLSIVAIMCLSIVMATDFTTTQEIAESAAIVLR